MSASIALQPGALERYETPSTSEPAWIKVTLITVALTFFVIFLLFPLGTVFVQALRKGWGVYLSALTSHDADHGGHRTTQQRQERDRQPRRGTTAADGRTSARPAGADRASIPTA